MAGTLKTNVQLGDSNTATQNFSLTAAAADGTMKLARGNAGATTQDIITVDANGRVAMPNNLVVFSAVANAATVSSGVTAKVSFDTEDFDTANAFDLATDRFQPPVAGYYQINSAILGQGTAISYMTIYVYKNGSFFKGYQNSQPSNTYQTITINVPVYLNGSTDYIEIWSSIGSTGTPNISGYVSGHLIAKA